MAIKTRSAATASLRIVSTPEPIILDYGAAVTDKLIGNLSGVAEANGALWTVSDETRTVECLEPHGDGFRLARQIKLDELFQSLPKGEGDLEAIDFDGGAIWLCGSHCRVREKPEVANTINPNIVARPSRHLFGCFDARAEDAAQMSARNLPFTGPGGLRRALRALKPLDPFLDLPSKEGGVDIEGLAVTKTRMMVGLRGPLLDSMAVVASFELGRGFKAVRPSMFVLDLGGLGVRDLARCGRDILILAGPVAKTAGPFRLMQWRPRATEKVQTPVEIYRWPQTGEHPEGVSCLKRGGRDGLIVLYDAPDAERIKGSRYRADWFAFASA